MISLFGLKMKEPTRTDLCLVNDRFEGNYPWFETSAQKMPNRGILAQEDFLDETEVQTRMSQVLHNFKLFDLHKLDWSKSFDDLGLDIYEQNAIITSIEHEFHVVFEDNVFDNFDNFDQIKAFVAADHNSF